jgi:hypothetical protein
MNEKNWSIQDEILKRVTKEDWARWGQFKQRIKLPKFDIKKTPKRDLRFFYKLSVEGFKQFRP